MFIFLTVAALTPQQILDLAVEYRRAGRLAEAEALYRQLLAMYPTNIDILHTLGVVVYEEGRFSEALDLVRRATSADPTVAEFHNSLGLLLADCDRLEESAMALETACRLGAGSTQRYNLGNTRRRLGQWDAAVTSYRAALQTAPNHVNSWLNLGLTLTSARRYDDALETYRAALEQCPRDVTLLINLGSLLQALGRLDEALQNLEFARALAPEDPLLLNNLGLLHKDRGESAGAVALLRQSLAIRPRAEVHSNLLYTLYLDPANPQETISAEHRRWNALWAAPFRTSSRAHQNERSPDRRLKIGYVSADLRDHVVGRALWPVFEAHDRTQVECICYAGGEADSVTHAFRSGADRWRRVDAWTDAQLADKIRDDGIDILIDLSLHTAGNRLSVFARKPAPVQVSWLGYPETSGVETIDFWLSDRFLSPPGAIAPDAIGQPFPLPDAWCCYPAPENAPELSELPSARNGYITFASFNNFAKINHHVLDLWARILRAVSDSRLLLLSKSGNHRDRVRGWLQERGIAPQRLEFLDYQPMSPHLTTGDYLQRYARVDIALDPFPYNGMTTTCDALWMGVPVVAFRGAAGISRASFSLLSNLGLADLAAATADAYVQLAQALAGDLPRLSQLRATLRERMRRSPLLDAPAFAQNLEAAYRQMWLRWCTPS